MCLVTEKKEVEIELKSESDKYLVYISEHADFKVPFVPEKFAIAPNYPNPFNPTTTIQFDLPYGLNIYDVNVTIYNMLGQKIKSLYSGQLEAGSRYKFIWDARNDKGHKVSSGIYFYQVKAGSFVDTKKMILIK